MRFECEYVERRDDEGRLEAIGVRWTEAHRLIETGLMHLFVFLFGGGLVGGAFALITGTEKLLSVAVLSLSASVAVLAGLRYMPGRERQLWFRRDGIVSAPLGCSTWQWGHTWMRTQHPHIASIESEQVIFPKGEESTEYLHGVRIFTRSGEVVHIAKNLDRDQAHMLAVRLTQALHEMREDLASGDRHWSWAAAHGQGQTPREVDVIIH